VTSVSGPPRASGTAPPTPPTTTLLRRALALRCPVCGSGGLFGPGSGGSLLGLPERCPGCGLRFDREAGHWTGSLGLNVIVSFTALFVVLAGGLALTWPDPPAGVLVAAALGTALVLPLAFAPWSATLWLVIDLRMRPLDAGEVRPSAGVAGHGDDRQPERQGPAPEPTAFEAGEAGEHPVDDPAG
jgi:uncharacterized protein (DUF983 family)